MIIIINIEYRMITNKITLLHLENFIGFLKTTSSTTGAIIKVFNPIHKIKYTPLDLSPRLIDFTIEKSIQVER